MAEASARGTAALLVAGVMAEGRSLGDQIRDGALAALPPPDRARAQRLALAALRQVGRADAILKPHLRKVPPPWVQAILRVATVEILSEGAPAHGVVDEAVALTRAAGRRAEGFTGLVNAVLRRVAEVAPERWAALPPDALPGWLRGRLMSDWGKSSTQAMEAAHLKGAPLDLTPKTGDAARLAQAVGGTALPTGSVRLSAPVALTELAGYAAGDWWVQDAAAAMPARALAPQPGEAVLDLCAAPGGKTLQLAAAGASVTSLDLSGDRMARVRENLSRCGLSADCVVADALDWAPERTWGAILLDAPCSATGTIRRHPDLPYLRDGQGIKALTLLQSDLIDRALALLAPGGRLVYATCSLLKAEGEGQVAAALARHPGLTVDLAAVNLPGIAPEWIGAAGLRLRPDYWPDLGGLDGFFVACLRKPA